MFYYILQRRGDKLDLRNPHFTHVDTLSEDEENASGTDHEGEDSEVDIMAADLHGTSHTNDVTPNEPLPLATVSSDERMGGASCPIIKLGVSSSQVLMEDPNGMCVIFIICCLNIIIKIYHFLIQHYHVDILLACNWQKMT